MPLPRSALVVVCMREMECTTVAVFECVKSNGGLMGCLGLRRRGRRITLSRVVLDYVSEVR